MDWRNGNTDILDMAFITQNLIIHDTQFQIGVDLGSDHLPIEITIDTTPHGTHSLTPPGTNLTRLTEVFESILEKALGSGDFSGHLSTNDLDRYADFMSLHYTLRAIKPFRNPKACDLRVTQFQMKP